MKSARSAGWVFLGLALVMGFWAGGQTFAAPTPIAASSEKSAAAQRPATSNSGSRIVFPPGHYPQQRLSNGQTHQIRSVLNVTHSLTFGDYVWDAAGVAPGPVWVRIDLARQLLSVFRGYDEIGTAVIIYGAHDHPTPIGTFHILQKSQYYHSKAYDAPMPYAMRLTDDGVAMHASHVRERFATHGCIGLPLEFARLLFGATSKGDPVEILADHPQT